ncbi:polyprenyl synthetase [Opitutaceae bacterium EW11]|nr:polyprenyl synthetase [Opitutaceae bacterium EW11]
MAVSPTVPADPSPDLSFSSVFGLLKPQMSELDCFLRLQLEAFEPEIRSMVDYCIDTSGKRIRPALVFLSGWRNEPVVSPDLIKAAAVVELVHLATLVHDDIMDSAELRRNRRTAAREYGAAAAVLLGDALFSHALNLSTQFPTTEVCRAVSDSMRKVCAGEIVQTLRRGTTNVTADDYRRIIDLKTAELFHLSCYLGSHLAGYSESFVSATSRFARRLGSAYQVYDDLADFFGNEQQIGKTLGTDLASGKLTLPLFALSARLPEPSRVQLFEEIQGRRPPDFAERLGQMKELGVFQIVEAEIGQELAVGEAELALHAGEPPTARLLRLTDVLRGQVARLKP